MKDYDFPMVDVLRLKALDDWRLWVRFSDGCEGEYDLGFLAQSDGPVVQPLKDPAYFKRVFVEMGAPTWPNGFDIDPIKMYLDMRSRGALQRKAA